MENLEETSYDLIVIGGGAAGFFGAIQAAEMNRNLKIVILEKSNKVLAKVKISGGGRCNVTHHCFNPVRLSHHYPRGEKFLQHIFKIYDASKTVSWFESKGVKLKTEEDGRMFPVTDNSQTIVDCLMTTALKNKIKLILGEGVISVIKQGDKLLVYSQSGKKYSTQKILITIGGNPNLQTYDWIASLGHEIKLPIPSLFTFNDADNKFKDLMGVAVPNAQVKITGTKFFQEGPLLITHWGLSGPAVIKLSAWAAEYLHDVKYTFTALVSWIGNSKEEMIMAHLSNHRTTKGKQKVFSNPLYSLPQRLWERLCKLADIDENKIWAELPLKNQNRLMEFVIRCPFQIKGKTTFKEEFVTCGGVDLRQIDLGTMQSKVMPGVYFAGEVVNIDGETGGFNFQSAWSTSFVAAQAIADEKS